VCAILFGIALIAAALGAPKGAAQQRIVQVVERDFHITVSPRTVPAGTVVFRVANHGPDAHELIVVRDDGTLPMRTDGITIDEDAIEKATAAGLEPAPAGAVRELHVRLRPGRYVLFCNMYGHYMGGMHSVVVVR